MKNKIAYKIALIYFLVGFLWILFSDRFLLSFEGSGNAITILQTYKGWFFVSITAILLFILVRNEINKKNKIESDLKKAMLKAEESDRLKSAFLSNMSHEIRTPLNGIMGFCELLLDESFGEEDKKLFAANLTRSGNDLAKLISDVMDISKIQENQLEINRKRVNLNNLLNVLYSEYQQSELKAARKRVLFKLILGTNDTEIELDSDPIRLMHVFRNLLNNAFFFTTEGFVHFGYEKIENGIRLFVEDSGYGIDESNKELIFKPFFKGINPIVGNKGFGLGLAISKGLIKLLKSDLQFNSTPDRGTIFYFDISNEDISSISPVTKSNKLSNDNLNAISSNPLDNKLNQN